MPNKKHVLIIGAGGLGREIESFLEKDSKEKDWTILGFLDDDPDALRDVPSDYRVIDHIDNYKFTGSDVAVMAIMNRRLKEKVFGNLKDKVRFLTYIHPSTFMGKFSEIGEGAVILANCTISTNVKIGTCVLVNSGTNVGHDSRIDPFSSIMSSVNIGGNCHLGERTFIGSGATLVPGLDIRENTRIGAGSIVIKSVKKPDQTIFGNPATRL